VNTATKECDYRHLDRWDKKFDAVVCLTQALNHMLTHEDLLAALKSMYERLNDNGLIILTQGTTHRTLLDEFRFSPVVNNSEFTRILARDIEGEFQTIHILDVFHDKDRNEMKKHSVRIRIILDGEFRSLLKEAGFSRADIYGSYERAPYDRDNSWKLIAVGRK
jgi:cobalamin biosynthesis Co2+ chelatase CbiK